MRTLLVVALVFSTMLVSVKLVRADPNVPDMTPHRHFIVTATGEWVAVGPQVCEDPSLQDAFNQFHTNLHFPLPGATGPEESAPGLRNGFGAELVGRPCTFVPS